MGMSFFAGLHIKNKQKLRKRYCKSLNRHDKLNLKRLETGGEKMKKYSGFLAAFLLCMSVLQVTAAEMEPDLSVRYRNYEANFAAIQTMDDIEEQGYAIVEEQVFPVILESFGEEELSFVPAFESEYKRLAIFVADAQGRILYKSNQLATNQLYKGVLEQPNEDISAVSFRDANRDGLTDIILITRCMNGTGEYAGKYYKTGDVLFQREGSFYRDYRISEKINRFSMNKSANCIVSFVRDGCSTEFLYTASTEAELLQNGFDIIEEQCYERNFEKLGKLRVVPGVFSISEYDVFMIYLINKQGYIVWSFQPMGDYDNLYALKGIAGKDVDGDGMKDLVVLARYSFEDADGEMIVEPECSIYYQRTGGFEVDTEFKESYQCTEDNTLAELVAMIRSYWGWNTLERLE